MAVTIRIPGVYYKGIHVVLCKLGPPDVWYRGGRNKKEKIKRKEPTEVSSIQIVLLFVDEECYDAYNKDSKKEYFHVVPFWTRIRRS